MQRSSLALKVPASLLPSVLSTEDSGAGFGSEPTTSSCELHGQNPRQASGLLNRGSSNAAGHQRTSSAALARTASAKPSAAKQGGTGASSRPSDSTVVSEPASANAVAAAGGNATSDQTPAGPEVQRVGSRRAPSLPGNGAVSAPEQHMTALLAQDSVRSQGLPSTYSSSVYPASSGGEPGRAQEPQPARPAPPSPPSSCGSSPRSSTVGRRSRSSTPPRRSSGCRSAAGDGSSSWPNSPGSSVQAGGLMGSSAEAEPQTASQQGHQPSQADLQQPRDFQQKQQRHQQHAALLLQAAARTPSSSRPSSRASSRAGGYLASTATADAKRSRPGSTGTVGSRGSSVVPYSRPASASPTKQPAWPCSGGRRPLEARVAKQMERDPADWTVAEVCDWLELVGLGQYRRRFVHNAVGGAVLLKLSNEELKVEIGIGPLGHREGLLTAINDLEEFWQQQEQQREQGGNRPGSGSEWGGSPGSSRPGSPCAGQLPGAGADYSLQRAYAQRAKLLRELEKAEGRQAHRAKAAEQALRVVGQASDEVRKLQASICQLDSQLGWQAATQQLFDPLDVHGAVAWQPAGKHRAAALRPGSGSPAHAAGGATSARSSSPGPGQGSPGARSSPSVMSRMSRRIMEARGGGAGGTFLDRLSRDIATRQALREEAARKAGRYRSGADEQLVEREREARDLAFLREIMEAKNTSLAEMLASGDPARVAEACDDVAGSYQAELQLSDDAVAAVRRLGSPGKKAAKLAGAVRSAQFMQRLQQDLSTREGRLQELQHKHFMLEHGNTAEQQERADLASAQAHFRMLGWSAADVDVAPDDTSAACDGPLAALLRRAVALQDVRERGQQGVDWEQPEWRRDGLADMQHEHNSKLQKAAEEQAADEAAAAAQGKQVTARLKTITKPREVPKPADRLGETVEQLAACRPAEVALLEGLAGYRKLVMTWRAVRAQQFIAFTRRDLEARKVKAATLERELYPDHTKSLPNEELEKFFDRLMADTHRRMQHKDELAETARQEALAKLMKSAPQALNHRRPRPASAAH